MKALFALLMSVLLVVSGHCQLSAVMVNTNGLVVRPTNFAAVNITNIGNMLTYQTNAAGNQPTNYFASYVTTLAMHSSKVFRFFVPYATSATSGSASIGSESFWRRIQTTGTNATIFVNGNPNGVRFASEGSPFGIEWSKPVWFLASFNARATEDAVIRVQLGGQSVNGTNIGPLNIANSALAGIGLILTNGNVFVEANHGSTNRSVSSSAVGTYDTASGSLMDIKLRSSGTNSIAVFFNGSFVTNLPFGPTNSAGNTSTSLNVSIHSGTSTNLNFIDLVQDKLSVIVE